MAYSDFTFAKLEAEFGLRIDQDTALFRDAPPASVPPMVGYVLEHYLPVGALTNTELSRSAFIIAPMLAEFILSRPRPLKVFAGRTFNVDEKAGLSGRCDYLLARSTLQSEIRAPVVIVFEAKNEDIIGGLPQCLAGMVAAQWFNARAGSEGPVFGAVTTGSQWRFLRLDGTDARIDPDDYAVQSTDKLFGILDACLREAPPYRPPVATPPPPASTGGGVS